MLRRAFSKDLVILSLSFVISLLTIGGALTLPELYAGESNRGGGVKWVWETANGSVAPACGGSSVGSGTCQSDGTVSVPISVVWVGDGSGDTGGSPRGSAPVNDLVASVGGLAAGDTGDNTNNTSGTHPTCRSAVVSFTSGGGPTSPALPCNATWTATGLVPGRFYDYQVIFSTSVGASVYNTAATSFTARSCAVAPPPPPPPPPSPSPQADLSITSLVIPDGSPGASVRASVTIANNGSAGTGSGFEVAINRGSLSMTCSSTEHGRTTTSALAAGTSRTVFITLTLPATARTYTATAMVDSDCAIGESSESNNTRSDSYEVSAVVPPPAPPPPPPPPSPECSDGIDNDGDGKIDYPEDPGCSSGSDNDETDSCVPNQGAACYSNYNNNCVPPIRHQGTIQCSGSCSVPSTPPSDSECSLPSLSCTDQSPVCQEIINKGDRCVLSWTVENATSCTVVGNGINQTFLVPPNTRSLTTPPLTATSLYTVTCYNGPEVFVTKTFTCKINPQFEEF